MNGNMARPKDKDKDTGGGLYAFAVEKSEYDTLRTAVENMAHIVLEIRTRVERLEGFLARTHGTTYFQFPSAEPSSYHVLKNDIEALWHPLESPARGPPMTRNEEREKSKRYRGW